MHVLTIPYDMIHNYMYAQELVRAKGLKEWQTLLYLLTMKGTKVLTPGAGR